MKIHAIADIARGYNLENSGKLRNDIMNECEDIINSFPIIESNIIKRDISLLPVYSINELFGFGKKKKYIEPSREDYNQAIKLAKSILFKDSLVKKAYKILPYKVITDEGAPYVDIMDYSYRTDRLPEMEGEEWDNFLVKAGTLTKEYSKQLEKYNIELEELGHKDGYIQIKKYESNKKVNESAQVVNEVFCVDYEGTMSYSIGFIQRKMFPLSWLKRSRQTLQNRLDKYQKDLKDFKKMNDEEQSKFCFKINAGNAAYSAGVAIGTAAVSNNASNGQYTVSYIPLPDKITPYNYPGIVEKMIKKLKYDIDKMDKLIKDKEKMNNRKSYRESYVVDLDSLKYTMRYKNVSLEEAANLIKEVNNIDESVELHCIMPDISTVTESEFIKINNTLLESGIVPCRVEFINEDFNSWNISRLEKQLEKAKNNKEALQKKLDEFKKMDEQQQKQYCMNKTIKNLAIGTLAGMILPVVGTAVHSTYITMKGDNTILGPKNYKQQLSNLIRAYDVDIKRYETALKSKTKK